MDMAVPSLSDWTPAAGWLISARLPLCALATAVGP